MYRLVIGLFLASLMAGCTSAKPAFGVACSNKSLPVLLDSTDLKELFQGIAAELCTDNCSRNPQKPVDGKETDLACSSGAGQKRETVLVTDFADLQSFLPNQSGLLMGELMRGSLSNVCCTEIIQAEFAKYFKLSESGLVVLTRKVSEIKNDEYAHSDAVVGTYSYQNNNKVVIFARKLNMETGKISRMVTREINYSCSGRSVESYIIK
jgi:hypothetical protein